MNEPIRKNKVLNDTTVVDAHTHLGYAPEMYIPNKEVKQFVKLMDHLGIDICLCTHLAALQSSLDYGHKQLIEDMKVAKGKILGFVVFNPHYLNESMRWVKQCRNSRYFVAVKIHPAWHRYPPNGPKYQPLWEYVTEFNIPVMSHTWDYDPQNPAQDFSHPILFTEIAQKYPSVKIILAHAGGRYNAHIEAVNLAQQYSNIYLELAGDSFLPGLIEYMVSKLGPKRILYGSDMIWIDPRYHLGSILSANITLEAKQKILGENAIKVYGLKKHIDYL